MVDYRECERCMRGENTGSMRIEFMGVGGESWCSKGKWLGW